MVHRADTHHTGAKRGAVLFRFILQGWDVIAFILQKERAVCGVSDAFTIAKVSMLSFRHSWCTRGVCTVAETSSVPLVVASGRSSLLMLDPN